MDETSRTLGRLEATIERAMQDLEATTQLVVQSQAKLNHIAAHLQNIEQRLSALELTAGPAN